MLPNVCNVTSSLIIVHNVKLDYTGLMKFLTVLVKKVIMIITIHKMIVKNANLLVKHGI